MTMVNAIMEEKAGTASGRPPKSSGDGDLNRKSNGNSSLQTVRRLESYSPQIQRNNDDEGTQVANGRLRTSHYGPIGNQHNVNSSTDSDISGILGMNRHLNNPPVTPSLLSIQGSGGALSVSKNDRIKREVIKLSIFPT